MALCAKCGHQLGVGRFCTNCGHPVGRPAPAPEGDWRTDTAERPAVRATTPPPPPSTPRPRTPPPSWVPPPAPPSAVPPRPRYPLFADEADSLPPPPAPTQAYGVPVTPAPAGPPTPHRRRPWGLWLGLAAVLAVIAGLAVWLATAGGQDGSTEQAGPGGPATSAPGRSAGSSSDLAPAGSVTSQAQVDVPATAPPNQDVQGNPVEYGATNMTDGVPETCWRMPGDGSGRDIRITLATETHLGSVGLINGYAKTATDAQGRKLDWYHGNRRLRAVEWVFDDGTTIRQRLRDTTAVQSLDVDATTTTITLRLLDVSPPGRGPASRNYTAISDLSLVSAGE